MATSPPVAAAMGERPHALDAGTGGRYPRRMRRAAISAVRGAGRHPLVLDRPAIDFFSGALLGNGGLGAVVVTRPDAVAVHLGHNDVWDIRVAEENADRIGTFRDVFARAMAVPPEVGRMDRDPWWRAYCDLMQGNYRKPYPRPFPCGTLLVAFDRLEVELLGHRLDIAAGVCTVRLLARGRPATIEIFVDMGADRLWLASDAPLERVRLMPDPDGLAAPDGVEVPGPEIPSPLPDRHLAFRQVLPSRAPTDTRPGPDPRDRAFLVTARFSADLERRIRRTWYGDTEEMPALERAVRADGPRCADRPPAGAAHRAATVRCAGAPLVACVQLRHGLASEMPAAADGVPEPDREAFASAVEASRAAWAGFWERSAVALDDEELERTWYRNHYFLRCAVRPGAACPGLWGNWSYRSIGTAWHGDYHMNYNCQQPFWGVFSSNHPELHLPYADLVDHLLPVSRRWARDYYGLRGAAFPHSAYPVEMNVNPYPVPTWGWEICETPWTVQSLWWHWRATMDRRFLERRAFGPIREAVLFLVEYLERPEARDEQRWGDDRRHVFPTVAPELFGVVPGLGLNRDCIADLTLIRFVLRAFLDACRELGRDRTEADLLERARATLASLADNPTAEGPEGTVFVAVPGADPQTVYNVPIAGMTVFPGEEHGLGSSRADYELAARSWRQQRLEGGNELVFAALQGARLGLLDLERFKRQIAYCRLPNGTCTDLALQSLGRYDDETPFDFMARMGVWVENFALPAVINECLLQGWSGTLRLFPNWPGGGGAGCRAAGGRDAGGRDAVGRDAVGRDAAFRDLRADGAFLVSASLSRGRVRRVEIVSEAGSRLRVLLPWPEGARVRRFAAGGRRGGVRRVPGGVFETATESGERIELLPRSARRSAGAATAASSAAATSSAGSRRSSRPRRGSPRRSTARP